ncbi:Crp/Fnr family transcriptional regulator [Spirosoma pomorum]
MPDALTLLKQTTDAITPLPPDEWQAFSAIWKPFSAKRKEMITATGEQESYLYFVVEGVQRVYYLDDQDREATLVFTYAPSFGGVIDSLMLQQPSRYFYETLTPSTFLRASFPELQAGMHSRPAIESMVRLGMTHTLSGLLERLVELQCYSSAEKMQKLLQRSPHLLQLIPHKYLANYIGVNATNFSKLMNSVRI